MPGAVTNAIPQDQLPTLPLYGFTEGREYLTLENRYQLGESERSVRPTTSRRVWKLHWRLTPAQLSTLKTFYDAHGLTVPFNFTPINDAPLYAAKFNSPWNQTAAWAGRAEVSLDLIQVS
jgi:hypothetical protein